MEKSKRVYCSNCKYVIYGVDYNKEIDYTKYNFFITRLIAKLIAAISRNSRIKLKCLEHIVTEHDTCIIKYKSIFKMERNESPYSLNHKRDCVYYKKANILKRIIFRIKFKYYKHLI